MAAPARINGLIPISASKFADSLSISVAIEAEAANAKALAERLRNDYEKAKRKLDDHRDFPLLWAAEAIWTKNPFQNEISGLLTFPGIC